MRTCVARAVVIIYTIVFIGLFLDVAYDSPGILLIPLGFGALGLLAWAIGELNGGFDE